MPFFKVENNALSETTNIAGPDFSLSEIGRLDYTYPVEGWHWFPDAVGARMFFGLPEPIDVLDTVSALTA